MRAVRLLAAAGLVALSALTAVGCEVGKGEGSVRGSLVVDGCDKDLSSYDMQPDFFGGQSAQRVLLIRIQRGGDLQEYQDALDISINDVDEIRKHLNEPVPVQLQRPPGSAPDVTPPLVQMGLSLRGSCGTPHLNPGDPPQVVLYATSGTVTFTAILDPSADSRDTNAKRIEGTFDVKLEDPRKPVAKGGTSHGSLTGDFKFFYQRGGPAQPFP
jgi:hypothetical protein